MFLKFYSTKKRTKRLKLCEKKIGHHTRLGENNLNYLANLSSKETFWFRLMTQEIMRNSDAQCNTKKSP